VADDLTGAADCAAPFRQAGFSALVLARLGGADATVWRAPVVSLNLHTRELPSTSRVRRVWRRAAPVIARLADAALVYQKIDSTLRGHAPLEVRLLRELLGLPAAVVAPAFPKLGRQTIDGLHRVHGVPIAQTPYAGAHRRRPTSSMLPDRFAIPDEPAPAHLAWSTIERGHRAVVDWLHARIAEGRRLITADAAHEGHLDILTRAVLGGELRLLPVGSAGWAERLARVGQAWLAPAPGTLAVVGSLNAVAVRQVQTAGQRGALVVPVAAPGVAGAPPSAVGDGGTLAAALAAGRHVVICTAPSGLAAVAGGGGRRLLRLAAASVRQMLATSAVSGLVIVGGETAHAVLLGLRATGLQLLGEIAVGLPYGRLMGGPFAGLPMATKAGGFGSDASLWECLEYFRRWPPRSPAAATREPSVALQDGDQSPRG
jgi:uncharacterized protein YgbK (DUF1537 family)